MLQHLRCPAMRRFVVSLRPRSTAKATVNQAHRGLLSTASTPGNLSRQRGFGSAAAGVSAIGATLVTVACLAASASRRAVLAAEKAPKLSDSGDGVASVLDTGVGMIDVGHDADGENAALVAAAHDLRRALTPPHQSLFRVVCILVYEDFSGNMRRITGTNAEPSTIGGSICAERAAMCKLREASDCKRVTKVVVVTDNPWPLAPGVLCREFLSAHLPLSTPVVMSGAGEEGSAMAGGLLYEENNVPPAEVASNTSLDESISSISNSSVNQDEGGDSTVCVATSSGPASSTCDSGAVDVPDASAGAMPVTATAAPGDGAGDGEGEEGTVSGERACVDVCTVGELYPWRNFYGVVERGDQLKLGFLRQQTCEDLSKEGVAEALGLDGAIRQAYDAAWRATEEDSRDGVHPIRYAAVALFSNGDVEVTHQLKALEYGATLDPVTLLAPAMMRRAMDGIRPSCVLLVDQFGNLHAPFAQARTFLSEHGFGESKVVLHGEDGRVVVLKAEELVPKVTTTR